MFFDLRCRRDEVKNKLIRRLRITPEEGLKMITRNKESYLDEMRQFCAKFIGPSGRKIFSCGSGHGSGCVDAYGFFQPCMLVRHPQTVYNLKKGSLKDAMENFIPKIKFISTSNPLYLARCARCFLKGLCEQCPGKSWMEHGTLDTPVDYLCEVAHVQARYLGLIAQDEKAWQVADYKQRIKKFCQMK